MSRSSHGREGAPHRLLVVTLPPQWGGGVYTQTIQFCRHAQETGRFEVRAAYAASGGESGGIGGLVALWPKTLPHTVEGVPFHAIVPRLPFLEASRYRPNSRWRALLDWADSVQVIGGGIAHGFPAAEGRAPYSVWVATTREADGAERRRIAPAPKRRIIDAQRAAIERMEMKTLRNASRVFVVSQYTRDLIARQFGPVGAEPAIVPIPVDPNRFQPGSPDAKVPASICYAGRVNDPRKRVPLLLGAMRRLLGSGVEAHLRLAGEAPSARLLDIVRSMDLDRHVSFLGPVPVDDLVALYQSSQAAVLASEQEGFGIVVAEAMSCGLPVVATRCGGPESLVEDGRTGFLVANGDEEGLAARLGDLLRDPGRAAAMGKRSRERVLARYTPDRVYPILLEFHDRAGRTRARSGEPCAV